MYRLETRATHLEVVDRFGIFVESFDFNEWHDATVVIERLNNEIEYTYELLIAKGRWLTLNHKRSFVLLEEFRKVYGTLFAYNITRASAMLEQKYEGYVLRNIIIK
jgi:hypothetical protein